MLVVTEIFRKFAMYSKQRTGDVVRASDLSSACPELVEGAEREHSLEFCGESGIFFLYCFTKNCFGLWQKLPSRQTSVG